MRVFFRENCMRKLYAGYPPSYIIVCFTPFFTVLYTL